jgi:hypothetical protein
MASPGSPRGRNGESEAEIGSEEPETPRGRHTNQVTFYQCLALSRHENRSISSEFAKLLSRDLVMPPCAQPENYANRLFTLFREALNPGARR